MNISRLSSNVPANTTPAPARPSTPKTTTERGVGGKPHAAHHSHGSHQDTPPGVVRSAEEGDGEVGQTNKFGARIDNFAARIETRIQNAIDNGNLSEEQATALKAATEKFTQLMNRIGNADFANAPKRQVMFALHQLGNEIQNILHPQETDPTIANATTTTGAVAAAKPTPTPTIDTVG